MTDDDDVKLDDKEEAQVRDLLKRSLSHESLGQGAPDLLEGVQRRIRRRSRGKFFADGWSTTQSRMAYVLVALITLLLVAVAYFAISPIDFR